MVHTNWDEKTETTAELREMTRFVGHTDSRPMDTTSNAGGEKQVGNGLLCEQQSRGAHQSEKNMGILRNTYPISAVCPVPHFDWPITGIEPRPCDFRVLYVLLTVIGPQFAEGGHHNTNKTNGACGPTIPPNLIFYLPLQPPGPVLDGRLF